MKNIEIKVNGDDFILVDVENLSMDDEFMKYEPQTPKEIETKELISRIILSGLKNFYRPKCDPSFTDENEEDICFTPGKMPAVGKTYKWWSEVAIRYCPELKSHLGTLVHYFAFLGVLIKKLVEDGKSVEWAWNAVCNDSKELGHYANPENPKFSPEPTGSKGSCGFCDLSNSSKILCNLYQTGYWHVNVGFAYLSITNPLSCFDYNLQIDKVFDYGVGWIILSI